MVRNQARPVCLLLPPQPTFSMTGEAPVYSEQRGREEKHAAKPGLLGRGVSERVRERKRDAGLPFTHSPKHGKRNRKEFAVKYFLWAQCLVPLQGVEDFLKQICQYLSCEPRELDGWEGDAGSNGIF